MYFQSKKEEKYHRILHIEVNLGDKFQLQQTILIFWTTFVPRKDKSGQKQEKMNITIE